MGGDVSRRGDRENPEVLELNHQAKAVANYISSLTIGQGRHAGERFKLLGWQRRFLAGAFGQPDDAALSCGRAAGKTTFASAIGCAAVAPDAPPFWRRTWLRANPGLDHLPDLEAVIRSEASGTAHTLLGLSPRVRGNLVRTAIVL